MDDGIGRIPFDQCTPDENHGRTGSRTEQYGASQVLPAQVRRDPRTKEDEKEEPGNSIHGKRLDEPVGNPSDEQAFRLASYGFDALKVDFHHHRINHEPNQNGNGNRNPHDL